jgi:hypothetical protein
LRSTDEDLRLKVDANEVAFDIRYAKSGASSGDAPPLVHHHIEADVTCAASSHTVRSGAKELPEVRQVRGMD